MKRVWILTLAVFLVTTAAAPLFADDWQMWTKKKNQKSLPASSYNPKKVLPGLDEGGKLTPTPFLDIPWMFFYHYLPSKEMQSLDGMNKRFGKLFIFNDMDGYAGFGFYVAANPSSSESYGDEVVVTLLKHGTKMIDTTADPGRSFFNRWFATQPDFAGARWGDDKMKDAYSKFAEVFGVDVIFYDSGNSWLVIKNQACVDQIVIGKAAVIQWGMATLEDAKAPDYRKAAALVAVAKFARDQLEPRHVDWVNRDMDPLALRFIDENKDLMPKEVKKKLYSVMGRIKKFFKFWGK